MQGRNGERSRRNATRVRERGGLMIVEPYWTFQLLAGRHVRALRVLPIQSGERASERFVACAQQLKMLAVGLVGEGLVIRGELFACANCLL
jgi:hypothetical protein